MIGLLRFARNDKDCGRVRGIGYDWIATVITLPRDDKGGMKMAKLQKLEKMFNSNVDFPAGYFCTRREFVPVCRAGCWRQKWEYRL